MKKTFLLTILFLLSPALAAGLSLAPTLQKYGAQYESSHGMASINVLGFAYLVGDASGREYTFQKTPIKILRVTLETEKMESATYDWATQLTVALAQRCMTAPKASKSLSSWLLAHQRPAKTATRAFGNLTVKATTDEDYTIFDFSRPGTPGKAGWKDYCLY